MANRLLTIDEAVLSIGIPLLRAQILACGAATEKRLMRHPIRDLMPMAIEPIDAETVAKMLAKCDEMESELRAKISLREKLLREKQ